MSVTARQFKLAYTAWLKACDIHGNRSPEAWHAYQRMLDMQEAVR